LPLHGPGTVNPSGNDGEVFKAKFESDSPTKPQVAKKFKKKNRDILDVGDNRPNDFIMFTREAKYLEIVS
jgi:hypothetical protein